MSLCRNRNVVDFVVRDLDSCSRVLAGSHSGRVQEHSTHLFQRGCLRLGLCESDKANYYNNKKSVQESWLGVIVGEYRNIALIYFRGDALDWAYVKAIKQIIITTKSLYSTVF
jgi:hypothetical protein